MDFHNDYLFLIVKCGLICQYLNLQIKAIQLLNRFSCKLGGFPRSTEKSEILKFLVINCETTGYQVQLLWVPGMVAKSICFPGR